MRRQVSPCHNSSFASLATRCNLGWPYEGHGDAAGAKKGLGTRSKPARNLLFHLNLSDLPVARAMDGIAMNGYAEFPAVKRAPAK
jgi:hypothetical protein